jgi:dynamin 1-like protein
MQACYVNTTHPDFLDGHKAVAIVQERVNSAKPPQAAPDPKSGRLAPGAVNNNKDLDVDMKKEEGFFGSFFQNKNQPKKKGAAAMEPVSHYPAFDHQAGNNF